LRDGRLGLLWCWYVEERLGDVGGERVQGGMEEGVRGGRGESHSIKLSISFSILLKYYFLLFFLNHSLISFLSSLRALT
jgi:hypothetical protein